MINPPRRIKITPKVDAKAEAGCIKNVLIFLSDFAC
jgi:hypothetical protein